MKVLVTGAQGFVGRYAVRELLRADGNAEVLGTGRSAQLDGVFTHTLACTAPARAPLPADLAAELFAAGRKGRYRYHAADLCDLAASASLLSAFQPDCILHLASGLRGDNSFDLVRNNIEATTALLMAIQGLSGPKPRVVLGSSGGVYGRFSETALPLHESQPCHPIDVYSATKLAAEHIAGALGRSHGLAMTVARIFNVVGPGQDERHVAGRFAAGLHGCATASDRSLSVGSLDTTRDFIDVRDVASALVLLASRGEEDAVYNVASGEETHIREVLRLLLERSGARLRIQSEGVGARANDVPRHFGDISALCALGFTPRFTLQQSLRDVYAYYQKRPPPSVLT